MMSIKRFENLQIFIVGKQLQQKQGVLKLQIREQCTLWYFNFIEIAKMSLSRKEYYYK